MSTRASRQQWKQFLERGPLNKNSKLVLAAKFRGRILGVDPSLRGTGLAVIEVSQNDQCCLLFSKTLNFSSTKSRIFCLGEIFREVSTIITQYKPNICAAEATIYVQNFQTAQVMGMSRGAVLAAIATNGLEIAEYAPLRIKQAICGYGRASKEQISRMVRAILKIDDQSMGFDETDAAAAALCHAFTDKWDN